MPVTSKARKESLFPSVSVREVRHIAANLEALRETSAWVENYLANPHPELGRPGAVCPFAQSALDQDMIRIAVVKLTSSEKKQQVKAAIQFYLQAFLAQKLSEQQRILQCTIVLFPDVTLEESPELIDRTKEEMKPEFIRRGLMLGEFHAHNNSPALHNTGFKPLRSPIPMLAIRHMVSTDLSFLDRAEYDRQTRLKYLEAYLAVPSMTQSSRQEVERSVAELRREICPYAGKS